MSVCTPVSSQCLEDVISAELSAKHGVSTAGALLVNSNLKGSKTFSFIDKPFRDPDYSSFVEPEKNVPVVVYGVGPVNALVTDLSVRHKLRKGEWEHTIIVPGVGPRLLVKDPKNNTFIKKLDDDNMPAGGYTAALPAPSTVIENAQKVLSTLTDKGVRIALCLNAATGAYGVPLDNPAPGTFYLLNPALKNSDGAQNPDLLDQLFDKRIEFVTSGVGYAAELSARGFSLIDLH
jgi:hypothetical protein